MSTSPPPKHPSFARIAGSLISIGLLAYLVYRQGWAEFAQAMKRLPLSAFLLALGLVLCSRLCVALRWYVLLRGANARVGFGQVVKLVFIGLFSSNFLPSTVGGDLVRLAGAVALRIDPGMSAASLLVDRLVGMAGMALLLPAGLGVVLKAGAAGGAGISMAAGWLPGLQAWAAKARQKLLAFLRSLLSSSVYWLKHPASLGWALLCTFGHQLFTYLIISTLLAGMGSPLPLWVIGGLWSFSYFVSLAPFSINGLGLQEVSIAYLYSHFGGAPMETGLALAVLLRLVFLFASLPGAAFLPGLSALKRAGSRQES